MGLDSVEILMKVEKTFDINIPDQETEKIITVNDFHNVIWRHLEGRFSEKCKSQNLFYRLRQSFIDTFNITKQDLTLDGSLNDIFPKENRRQAYFSFANANNIKLPDLMLTKPWAVFLYAFGFATILGGLVLSIILVNFFDYDKWTFLIPIVGIALTYFVSLMLNSKRIIIEPATIREFVQNVLSTNYSTLVENGVNRKDVESVINHIIADMSGLELHEVTPEKKIHDDLGIN